MAGYVSEHAAYHHGEASLCGTIVGMAQNFVGSNNVNLLVPNGQFGSRLMGGKDSASPRYIFTYLEPITDKVFRKEDAGILKHLDDDGMTIEPEFYLPCVPVLLINGCVGIGTGFSTDIPPYNPTDLVRVLRERITGRLPSLRAVPLKPWWQGFKGLITEGGPGCWITHGISKFDDSKNTITITELPVGVWTKDYKGFLDEVASVQPMQNVPKSMEYAYTDDGKPVLKGFDDLYTDEEVKFVLYFDEDTYEDMKAHPGEFEKRFRLTSSWRTTNMVAFDTEMKIQKYDTVGQILEGFYAPRLAYYEKRRLSEMERLEAEAVVADSKARFIRAVLEGSLDLRRASDEQIMAAMRKHELPVSADYKGKEGSLDGWDYLLRLRMDRVKASAVADAEEAVMIARKAVADLRETTAGQLWLKDLMEFEVALELQEKVRVAAASTTPRERKVVKKTVTK